jgi:hypothetical protein
MKVSGQLHATAALPRGKSPATHWTADRVGHRISLEDVEKRKFLTLPGLKLRLAQPVASRYTDYAIQTRISRHYKIMNFLIIQFFSILLSVPPS